WHRRSSNSPAQSTSERRSETTVPSRLFKMRMACVCIVISLPLSVRASEVYAYNAILRPPPDHRPEFLDAGPEVRLWRPQVGKDRNSRRRPLTKRCENSSGKSHTM